MTENTQIAATSAAPAWMRRIELELSTGKKPAYDDLEEGVHSLLMQTSVLRREVREAAAAFDFIEQESKLVSIRNGVLTLRLELNCDIYTNEGARRAIAARIAELQEAKRANSEPVLSPV